MLEGRGLKKMDDWVQQGGEQWYACGSESSVLKLDLWQVAVVFTLLLLCLLHSFSFISANMEGDIRAGEHFEKELQQEYMEAQSLGHQRLRSAFENEKGLNVDQVRKMRKTLRGDQVNKVFKIAHMMLLTWLILLVDEFERKSSSLHEDKGYDDSVSSVPRIPSRNDSSLELGTPFTATEVGTSSISRSKLGSPPAANSWLGSLFATIIGILKISISNVHIRYEDSIINPGHPFSSGVILAKLAAATMDEQGMKTSTPVVP
ncbi:hypothetical protein PVL29_015974 [Vitis rotundifolia]|uniref:Uncharacterized protein n=1 Tax=Vitis rotundifolia TaxID=103349 RepID=A0AA38ZFB9_VITRO|nr:hypothetical protein PVL29_015974 [Vitis rotundifolia]